MFCPHGNFIGENEMGWARPRACDCRNPNDMAGFRLLARGRALGEGVKAQQAGVALADNPYRGTGDPYVAGGWTMGWKRSWENDPARANDVKRLRYSGPKRHAGHTGAKNRL